jgi:ribosome-associated heat shock protein Hsp15
VKARVVTESGPEGGDDSEAGDLAAGRLRLDKWLWYARFLKTRSLAADLCRSGTIRLAGGHVSRPNQLIRPGDVLTFPLGPRIRVIRVLALADHRGPAPQARLLYEDLSADD